MSRKIYKIKISYSYNMLITAIDIMAVKVIGDDAIV